MNANCILLFQDSSGVGHLSGAWLAVHNVFRGNEFMMLTFGMARPSNASYAMAFFALLRLSACHLCGICAEQHALCFAGLDWMAKITCALQDTR